MQDTTKKAMNLLCARRETIAPDLTQLHWVSLLMDFGDKHGEEGLQGLAGFYLWAFDNIPFEGDDDTKRIRAIRSTMAHDINGMNERGMQPRSASYAEYFREHRSVQTPVWPG